MSLHTEFQHFSNWLHLHPEWGGLAAFIVAFAESLAFIGTIVPGSITMTAIGILIGSGVVGIPITVGLAILGAVVGDALSYFLGYRFKKQLPQIWPFRKYPHWLDHGKTFFSKHGGKSVFMGRFIGPIRAMIPILAGMLHMRPIKFFTFDIIAAAIWAPVYLLPGFLIGYAALSLPAGMAAKLIITILIILVVIWLIVWLIKLFSTYLYLTIDKKLNVLWGKMAQSKRFKFVCVILQDANRPHHHGQLILGLFGIVTAILFVLTFFSMIYIPAIQHLNHFFYYVLRGFRADFMDEIMIVISAFAYKAVVLPLGITIFIWLGITKRWRAAFHWIIVCILSAGIAYAFKDLYFSPRPIGIFFIKPTSSFPSGHVTISAAFYGFLAWLICLEKPQWKKPIYGGVAIYIVLVAISRMYLGEHWLTDVLGGIFLSTAIACFAAISYQRKVAAPPKPIGIIVVTIVTIAITGSYYLDHNFKSQLKNTQPVWLQTAAPIKSWWEGKIHPAPLYRLNRFGRPAELLNLQWAGNIDKIENELIADGWQPIKAHKHKTHLLHKIKHDKELNNISIGLLPKLLDDQAPVLVMIKFNITNAAYPIVITLWPANVLLTPNRLPLWVGTIDYHPHEEHLLFHGAYYIVPKDEALHSLKNILSTEQWEVMQISRDKIPLNLIPSPDSPHYIILIKPKQAK